MKRKKINHVLDRLGKSEKVTSDEMLFSGKYGYFTKGGREFVITTPHTPALWANFLTNGRYTAFVTPTGGGYSWEEESGFNRVLRENPLTHLSEDIPGRYIYIRDEESGEYWSSTYQPVQKATTFRAVHSLGYSKSGCEYAGIDSEVTYFLPIGEKHEIWWLKLHNKSAKTRRLKLFTYCEFVLGSYKPDILENSFSSLFTKGQQYYHSLLFTKTTLQTKNNLVASTYDKIGFLTSSEHFSEYELSRRDFIGFGNSLSKPAALEKNHLYSCPRAGENLIGCVAFDVILKPGEMKQAFFAVGTASKRQDIQNISRSLTEKKIAVEFQRVISFWDNYISRVWIETPDEGLNIWFNYWLKYQTYFNAHWSEMDSFYIGGGGGFGFRDTAQHIWGILPFEREIYLKQLRFLLSHQYPNGNVPHGVSIFTDELVYAPHSDDPCWLVFALLNYIEETNDIAFLDEDIHFADTEFFGNGHKGSVLNHLVRGTDYSLRHLSERGIPQMRIADWNDALSTGPLGKGESFLVAGLLAYNLQRLVRLLERIGRHDKVEEYSYAYKRLAESVVNFGWDGEWFLRGTKDHQKQPIGGKANERGKIFLDSNAWLCISELAGKYAKKTMSSLWKYLMTKHGALLFNPAYWGEDRERGVISQFVPGAKENAAIFMHANAWFMIALAKAGDRSRAWELLQSINPVNKNKIIDTYKVEPYVLPEFIFGNESDKFGEGSFTWVTGSAEWFLRGILDYFLGLRPEYDKLVFDPKVPESWNFSVEREFQGKRYRGEYKKGKKSLKVIKKIE